MSYENGSPSLLDSLQRYKYAKDINKIGLPSSKLSNIETGENSSNCDDSDSLIMKSRKRPLQIEIESDSDDEQGIMIIRKKKKFQLENSYNSSSNADSENGNKETKLTGDIRNFFRVKSQPKEKNYVVNIDSESSSDLNSDGNVFTIKKEGNQNERDKDEGGGGNSGSDSVKEILIETSSDEKTKGCEEEEKEGKEEDKEEEKDEDNEEVGKEEKGESEKNSNDSSRIDSSTENFPEERRTKKSKKRDSLREMMSAGPVYDSSDSDSEEEIPVKVTGVRLKVLEFLNNAPQEELEDIKCTQKKINELVKLRPFNGWRDLVEKCYNRIIGTEILNLAQDLLTAKAVLSDLMKKCKQLAKKTEEAIVAGSTSIIKPPSTLAPGFKLKSYQMVGLNWMAVMHSNNLSGILADEMGLGKTIQVISFVAYLKENNIVPKGCPHLIVVPSSTLENWQIEFRRWCPTLSVAQYYGSQDERRMLRYQWIKEGVDDIEVILSTYQTISTVYEDKKLFRILKLYYAIFDEGHMLKNMNSQRYESLLQINSKHKLLLTGTPIQNSLLELMSLLMFIMPHMFANKMNYIKYLLEKKKSKEKVNTAQDKLKFERENTETVKEIMAPFMLRRVKADVLQDLPKKTTEIIECPMVDSQLEKYSDLLQGYKDSTKKNEKNVHYVSIFTNFRRLANHPLTLRYLFDDEKLVEMAKRLAMDSNYKENDEKLVLEDLSILSDHEIHQIAKTYKCVAEYELPDIVFLLSGKFAKFDELLPALKQNGHRVLIFSQFCFVLDLLEEYMRIRNYTYLRIDGQTPVNERQQLIDLYNMDTEIFAFLLTTRAGGVGINLTSADTVIIHDVDFNPYNDKQAEDRCHRMGQTKDVRIIRLVSKGTIEEGIQKVAQEKANLGKEVTSGKEDEAENESVILSLLRSSLGLNASRNNK